MAGAENFPPLFYNSQGMSNEKSAQIIEGFKHFIGKEFTASPSPFTNWLKPVLLSAEAGKLAFQFTIRHDMTNPFGGLHGGVAAAILDDIIGATMYSLGDDGTYATINNVIDYFAVAREGENVIAETVVIKKGRNIVNAQCEIWNADKTKLVARGYSNMFRKEF